MNVQRDFKQLAAGDRDDEFDFPPIEEAAAIEIETSPHCDSHVTGPGPKSTQITARAVRKLPKLMPSEREWYPTMEKILCGRLKLGS